MSLNNIRIKKLLKRLEGQKLFARCLVLRMTDIADLRSKGNGSDYVETMEGHTHLYLALSRLTPE